METTTTLTIRISTTFTKQTDNAVFEDYIQQAEDESDVDFLKRAAVILEVLRNRSKPGPFYHE